MRMFKSDEKVKRAMVSAIITSSEKNYISKLSEEKHISISSLIRQIMFLNLTQEDFEKAVSYYKDTTKRVIIYDKDGEEEKDTYNIIMYTDIQEIKYLMYIADDLHVTVNYLLKCVLKYLYMSNNVQINQKKKPTINTNERRRAAFKIQKKVNITLNQSVYNAIKLIKCAYNDLYKHDKGKLTSSEIMKIILLEKDIPSDILEVINSLALKVDNISPTQGCYIPVIFNDIELQKLHKLYDGKVTKDIRQLICKKLQLI